MWPRASWVSFHIKNPQSEWYSSEVCCALRSVANYEYLFWSAFRRLRRGSWSILCRSPLLWVYSFIAKLLLPFSTIGFLQDQVSQNSASADWKWNDRVANLLAALIVSIQPMAMRSSRFPIGSIFNSTSATSLHELEQRAPPLVHWLLGLLDFHDINMNGMDGSDGMVVKDLST